MRKAKSKLKIKTQLDQNFSNWYIPTINKIKKCRIAINAQRKLVRAENQKQNKKTKKEQCLIITNATQTKWKSEITFSKQHNWVSHQMV